MRETENLASSSWNGWLGLAASVVIVVAILGAAPLLLPAATSPVEPAEDTGRGTAVALDGGWLAMGARFEPSTGSVGIGVIPAVQAPRVGAVLLFQKSGAHWAGRGMLFAGDAQPGDQFGAAVALRDGILAIGAPGWNHDRATRRGAVYFYRQVEGEWTQQGLLTICNGDSIDRLGHSLALDGGWLVAAGTGKICLVPLETAPSLAKPLEGLQPATAGVENIYTGESVALAGDILAVGSPGQDLGADRARGKVEVFRLVGGRWGLKQTLRAPRGHPFDQFGSAVAVSGNRIAVGAVGASVGGPRSGAVYVFVPSGPNSEWTALWPPITAVARQEGDRFGATLAMDGDRLVVGAPPLPLPAGHGPLPRPRPGSVYVFDLSTTPALQVGTLVSGSSGQLDLFGAALALRGGEGVVGAPLATGGGTSAGSAWSFTCTGTLCTLGEPLPTKTPGTGAPQ